MFSMSDLDGTGLGVLWFHCGAERFHELLEIAGIRASPYMAKAFWVTLEQWDALRPRGIEAELKLAHGLIYEKLPKRTKAVLAMPQKERAVLIRDRKKTLAARETKKTKQKKLLVGKLCAGNELLRTEMAPTLRKSVKRITKRAVACRELSLNNSRIDR